MSMDLKIKEKQKLLASTVTFVSCKLERERKLAVAARCIMWREGGAFPPFSPTFLLHPTSPNGAYQLYLRSILQLTKATVLSQSSCFSFIFKYIGALLISRQVLHTLLVFIHLFCCYIFPGFSFIITRIVHLGFEAHHRPNFSFRIFYF